MSSGGDGECMGRTIIFWEAFQGERDETVEREWRSGFEQVKWVKFGVFSKFCSVVWKLALFPPGDN